jgi:type II secretory ATPase GspE/PulE/Tfp pilus assembly ATPase PilB-like protein
MSKFVCAPEHGDRKSVEVGHIEIHLNKENMEERTKIIPCNTGEKVCMHKLQNWKQFSDTHKDIRVLY